MRGIILIVVVVALALYGLMIPQIGIYAYVWFSLFRPDVVAFAAGRYNYSEWLAMTLMAGSFRFVPNALRAWVLNPITLLILMLEAAMAVSSFNSEYQAWTMPAFGLFTRGLAVLLFIPLVITTLEELKRLYVVTAIALGTWGLWHGATGVLHGGLRIYNGIGGFMSENNTFACGLTMVIPFCWYSIQLVKSKYLKLVLQAMTWGSVACTILTFSRGAAVALVFILLMMVMQAKRKGAALVAILVIGLGPALLLVHDKYFNRMETIATYESDGSALSRIFTMKGAIEVWKTHPYLGVGMGSKAFMEAAKPFTANTPGAGFVVHNSYLEMLSQCGLFAFFFLLCDTAFRPVEVLALGAAA